MMMLNRKKKMAIAIVAGMPGASGDSPDDSSDPPYEALAGEVKRALRDGSDKDLADALKAFYMACDSDDDSGSYEDTQGEG